ncbi:unnamed protein product [Paramecium pentaurelia]|uniref:Uncharacterized protein n=1 Tax=Paramecium pentaurelia TaxID=43138 RepID=A0A8S1YPL2_9CILI|nr:unnamed protein product [Paramecium pentaurelia]
MIIDITKIATQCRQSHQKECLKSKGKNNQNEEVTQYQILRGESVKYLLEIRKRNVLKEATKQNVKSIYVLQNTQEKDKNEISSLMNLYQFHDKIREENELLFNNKQKVLLIQGLAEACKSKRAKKIEKFIWKLHDRGINHEDDYGFEDLQFIEQKDILQKKESQFLEKFYINQTHIKRNDIFTSNNYAQWLAPEDKNQFKEIQLLNFDQVQKQEYFKKLSIQSITMLIFDITEWQVYPQNQNRWISKIQN